MRFKIGISFTLAILCGLASSASRAEEKVYTYACRTQQGHSSSSMPDWVVFRNQDARTFLYEDEEHGKYDIQAETVANPDPSKLYYVGVDRDNPFYSRHFEVDRSLVFGNVRKPFPKVPNEYYEGIMTVTNCGSRCSEKKRVLFCSMYPLR